MFGKGVEIRLFLFVVSLFLLSHCDLAVSGILVGRARYIDLCTSLFGDMSSGEIVKIWEDEDISCVHFVVCSSVSVEIEKYKELARFCKEREIEVVLTFSSDFFKSYSRESEVFCCNDKRFILDVGCAVKEVISSIDVRGVGVELKVISDEDICKHFMRCNYCREKFSSKYKKCAIGQLYTNKDKRKVLRLARESRYEDVVNFINNLFCTIEAERMNVVKFIIFDYNVDREIVKFVTNKVKPNAVGLKISENDIDEKEIKRIENIIADIHWRKAAALIICPDDKKLVDKLNTIGTLVEQYIFYFGDK